MLLKANGKFRHAFIPVWLIVIVLLTAAYGASKTVTPHDESPRPTAPPSTSAVGAASARRPAGEPPSQYLKFGRLTTENGLSSDTVWGIAQDSQGSLFKVKISLQMVEAGTAIPGKAPVAEVIGLQADQPEWRILVVDDNLENRVLLTTLLTNIGCNVKEAKNGEEAISIFQEWHLHFIWMDMRMPVLDGFEATRKIWTLTG